MTSGALEGKVAIITGGSSGIGEAIVRRFRADRVTVRWPSGRVQTFGPLTANAGYLLKEGEEKAQPRR